MAADLHFANYCCELLGSVGPCTARRMFGGMGIYTGEKMFAFLVNNDVGFKLGTEDYEEALRMPGAGPMRPDKESEPMREYAKMPRAVLDDAEKFQYWLEKSAAYVRRPKLAAPPLLIPTPVAMPMAQAA